SLRYDTCNPLPFKQVTARGAILQAAMIPGLVGGESMRRILAFLTFALVAALPAAGQGIGGVTVNGNEISLSISLPGGLGADLTLGFEEVTGLSLANLGISA